MSGEDESPPLGITPHGSGCELSNELCNAYLSGGVVAAAAEVSTDAAERMDKDDGRIVSCVWNVCPVLLYCWDVCLPSNLLAVSDR